MALLNATDQAKILYGAGNKNISSKDIAAYLATPGLTAKDIQAQAIKSGVSVNQISQAMALNPQYSTANINNYLSGQGINQGLLNVSKPTASQPINISAATAATNPVGPQQVGSIPATSSPVASTTNSFAAKTPDPVVYKEVKAPAPVEFKPIVAPPPVVFNPAVAPPPVVAPPITIDARDTVAGQLYDFTNNPNNPLNVQAATAANQWSNRRGLLDSTMGLTAAQDAVFRNAMPVAQQDAGTNFSAKQENAQRALQAGLTNAQIAAGIGISDSEVGARVGVSNADRMAAIGTSDADRDARIGVSNADRLASISTSNADRFSNVGIANTDIASRINMLNAGIAKDWAINQTNIDLNKYTANLDADTKLAVANVQALANETGLAADLGKNLQSYMSGIFTSNMSTEAKAAAIKPAVDLYNDSIGFFSSIKRKSGDFTFGANAAAAGGGTATEGAVSAAGGGTVTEFNIPVSTINPLSYTLEPAVLGNVADYERSQGIKLDKSKIAPEALVMDIKAMAGPGVPITYTASDGQNKVTQRSGYDIPKLLEKTKSKNTDELFDKLFQGVPWPNSIRADPMFYIYK